MHLCAEVDLASADLAAVDITAGKAQNHVFFSCTTHFAPVELRGSASKVNSVLFLRQMS